MIVDKIEIDDTALAKAKAERYQLSARILSGKEIKVQLTNQPHAPFAADYNTKTKVLRLNESVPFRVKDPIKGLILDRAKLYHEVGHSRYTATETKRSELADKSKNQEAFLTFSGILEDGRQEREMERDFPGTAPYLDVLLDNSLDKESFDPITGAMLYVRHGFWRNEVEAKFWQPYQDKIDKAIATDATKGTAYDPKHGTNVAVQVAFDIIEAIAPELNKPPQPPTQPDPNGEGDGDEGTTGDTDDESEPATGAGRPKSPISDDARDKLRDIAKDATDLVQGEAQSEWNGIIEQVTGDPIQEYASASEMQSKDVLRSILESIKTETARSRYSDTREGILNTLALPKVLTPSQRVFKTKHEHTGKPYVALLLDASGSMSSQMLALSQSARIINGALRESKIDSKTIVFGVDTASEIAEYPTIPTGGIPAQGGTPTGNAMQYANDWFDEVGATRPLVIIITDGTPNDIDQVLREKTRTNAMGGTVIGVELGVTMASWIEAMRSIGRDVSGFANQFDVSARLNNVADLPALLEPMLLDYIAGK